MSSLAIFFSYALQFYVVMDIIGPNLIKPYVPDRLYLPAEYTTRILLNVFICMYVRVYVIVTRAVQFTLKCIFIFIGMIVNLNKRCFKV